jgi:geranylgeranyl pyrophosphate synthase
VSELKSDSRLEEALQALEDQMHAAAGSEVALVQQAARHIIEAGGKRLRPRLLLYAYQAAGGQDPAAALPLGVAIELIHTATLVHDDINDHSALRRGRVTVNAKWGRTIALLTGDFLFTRAYRLMAPEGDRYNELLAEACTALVEGEVLQAVTAKSGRYSREVYYRIIALKTAALFSCAARLGALKAGAPEAQVDALGRYAHDLGLAFQIVDDVLDLIGDPEIMGKPAHEDSSQRKFGLASVAASGDGTGGNGVKPDPGRDTDVLDALALPDVSAALASEGMARARELSARACLALEALPPSPARAALERLARGVVERDR